LLSTRRLIAAVYGCQLQRLSQEFTRTIVGLLAADSRLSRISFLMS